VEALEKAILFSFLPLLVIQCVIGVWNWRLTLNYRSSQRKRSRTSERSMRQLLALEQELGELEQELGALEQERSALEQERGELLRKLQQAGLTIADVLPGFDAASLQPFETPAAAAPQSSPRPRKLGVALSGGGGKGAYQVGVLRALRAAGVRPDVIAGTSVGALNATLLCLDELEFAADFWSNVSFGRVAKVSLANLAALPLLLFALITNANSEAIDARARRTILFQFYILIFPANIAGVLFAGVPWLAAVASVAACVSVVTMGFFAESLVGRLGLAILNNEPLAAKIQDIVRPERLRATRTPLYVTVAARQRTINPNSPVWYGNRILVARRPYVPEYKHLEEEPDADIQQIVLQSAAIPFGVFPLRRIGGLGYVDGGVADNVPIQPLIDAACTCIVVIHLDPKGECDGWRLTDPNDLRARLGYLRELRRLARLTSNESIEELTRQARSLEASEDLQWQRRRADLRSDYSREDVTVVHIVPSESLGNFLTGTMNFDKRKARRLMELGERDALKALSGSSDLAAWSAQEASHLV
jgi:NTE family protein